MAYYNDIDSMRGQQIDAIKQLQDAEARRLQQQTEQQVKQLQAQRPQLDQRFTDQAQQAYIQKKQAEKQLPQQMAAQGYNGGLAESSRIALDSRYGNSYNTLQRDYNGNLDNLQRQVDSAQFAGADALAGSSNRFGGMINDANFSYNQMLQQARSEEQARQMQMQLQQQQIAQQQLQAQQQMEQQRAEYEYKAQQAALDRELQKAQQQYEWENKQKMAAAEAAAKQQKVTVSGGGNAIAKGTGGSTAKATGSDGGTKPAKSTGKNVESIYNTLSGWVRNDPSLYMNKNSASAQAKIQKSLQDYIHLGKISVSEASSIANRLGF